jgi:uracil DNA glycosylase
MFPPINDTFKALSLVKPKDCQIVIFGQDPYPRKESAVGICVYAIY